MSTQFSVVAIIFVIIAVIILFNILKLIPWGIWWQLRLSGYGVPALQLLGMKLRQREGISSVPEIVETYIRARKAGIPITLDKLEIHALTNGHINNVIQAIITTS